MIFDFNCKIISHHKNIYMYISKFFTNLLKFVYYFR